VDESFSGDYLVAAAIIPAGDVANARKVVSGLLDKRQRRIHFKDESPARKNRILDAFDGLDLEARVYLTSKSRTAREKCLGRLVPDLAAVGVSRLVLERADTLVDLDRRIIYQLVRTGGLDLQYEHLRSHEDLLLCIADAVAWCAAKGGPWQNRIQAYTTTIRL